MKVALITCAIFTVLMLPGWLGSYAVLVVRILFVGALVLLAFGLFETWPARLPRWMSRWGLQVFAVAAVIPVGSALAYALTTVGDPQHWWQSGARLAGFTHMTIMGLLVSPWIAVAALLRQIKDVARKQALTFELERSEYERSAVDARLRLLQAQVAPHFLFNTLANVRELVSTGSPRAAPVLESLIAYLRATVPRLNESASTLGQELELVHAYLTLMHMRMPDRLQFTLEADEEARALVCPPMTILTLVENAMRHGIDPSEEGGRIDVRASVKNGRCLVEVVDTGMGLARGSGGLGTGLANLRERLQLAFAGDTSVTLVEIKPHGVRAQIDFPVHKVKT
ncbi:MAG: histidine kinase [Betaproteobacteria bacterium]